MPSVHYYNQMGPFWDFVANLEQQGTNRATEPSHNETEQPNPWAQGWGGFPFGPMPHRGRHGHGHDSHRPPPPPPPHHEGRSAPPADNQDAEAGPSEPRGPPPPFSESDNEERGQNGRHGHGRHGPGARGGFCGGRRGGLRGFGGKRGHFHPYGGFGPFGQIAEMFQDQLFGEQDNEKTAKSEDFVPEVDVFDTESSFVVHVSLPGVKKEDAGVNWDAEKSELSIAGVVYRPGDEEFLKTLALDERKVGAFERKVRLGSRANPAQVDVDGITARLEDGVLRVDVPKLDAGYVEIKKVDIE